MEIPAGGLAGKDESGAAGGDGSEMNPRLGLFLPSLVGPSKVELS
jgi:hypothetical protein